MPLVEAPRFRQAPLAVHVDQLALILAGYRDVLNSGPWVYCGYVPLTPVPGVTAPAVHVHGAVDNAFQLERACGFEEYPVVVTAGVRSSRFAAVICWEVLHVLRVGGLWIDVDDAGRCSGTPLSGEDLLQRPYFRLCLHPESASARDGVLVQTFRKTTPAMLASRIADTSWTFGILTSGPSRRAAQMAQALLALDLPKVEVIFCGPRPDGVAADPRVRSIDLARPEPRGWISRKKNLLADAASHENLCLVHDRFVVTPEWADALRSLGSRYSIATFPQVYFADLDRQFPQRYADYQVLLQARGIDTALATHVYAGDRVFYAPYDDFYETAFCCGGLYVAKRSLWQWVRQHEALYHCEWEDVSFGLECQKRGVPHRVGRGMTAESMTPHPMALTRIHDLVAPDQPVHARLHLHPDQADAATVRPHRFKPVVGSSREEYYGKVVRRFNTIPGGHSPLRMADVAACRGVADFWRVVQARVEEMTLETRSDIASVAFFLSDCIYNWPNCELQSWIRLNEGRRGATRTLDAFDTVVGWGTGSLFRSARPLIGRSLAFAIDSDPGKWNTSVDSVAIKPPAGLLDLDPARTAVIVFSCFTAEVLSAIRELGPYTTLTVPDIVESRPFQPLPALVSYFEEVERYYPALFSESRVETAA